MFYKFRFGNIYTFFWSLDKAHFSKIVDVSVNTLLKMFFETDSGSNTFHKHSNALTFSVIQALVGSRLVFEHIFL